jgi:hypothetical protein
LQTIYKIWAFRRNTTQKNFGLSHILMPENNTYRETPPFGGAIQEAGVKNNKIKKVLPVTLWKLNAREGFRFPLQF